MSRDALERLKAYLEENRDWVDEGTPASDQRIAEAEAFLGISFPDAYKDFLRSFGTLSVGALEYFGIAGGSFEESSIPNGIWFTAVKRRQLGLPPNLVILSSSEGDEYHCLDVGEEGTAPVVVWDVPSRSVTGVRSEDLFEYILEEVKDLV